jgi:hypothetical protein
MVQAGMVVYWDEVSAWATIGIGVVGVGVLYQLFGHSRNTNTETIRQALDRWHGPELLESRKLLAASPTTDELIVSVRRERAAGSDAYEAIHRHLDYFEALAVAHRVSGRGLSALDGMLGNVVLAEWVRWESVIPVVWGDSVTTYPNFKRLASNLERFRRRAEMWRAMRRFFRYFVTTDYGRYPI